MNEALKYLEDQPQHWPRWRRGFAFTEAGPVPTSEQHLFIFASQNVYGFGVIHPACYYIDGAERVVYDDERRLETTGSEPLCNHCFEAELQHGVDSLS